MAISESLSGNPASNKDRNSDQLAIEQYFQSPTYLRTVHQIDPYAPDGLQPLPINVDSAIPAIQMFDWPHTQMHSRIGAWLGQGILLWALASIIPIAIEAIESFSFFRSASFVTISLIAQTVILPALTSFAFVVVFAMLWHRSIIIRFAIASIASLVALGSFCVLIATVEGDHQDITRIWHDTFPIMLVYFIACGLMGLVVQLFTPWTLIEKGVNPGSVAPTGMRWMIELTAISAFCFAILVNLDLNENLAGVFIFGAMSVGGGFVALSVIRTRLRHRKPQTWTKVVSPALALAYTLFFNGMLAIEQYKNSIKMQDAILILALSIYGAAIVMGVSFAHIKIAKACGWTLVARGKATC